MASRVGPGSAAGGGPPAPPPPGLSLRLDLSLLMPGLPAQQLQEVQVPLRLPSLQVLQQHYGQRQQAGGQWWEEEGGEGGGDWWEEGTLPGQLTRRGRLPREDREALLNLMFDPFYQRAKLGGSFSPEQQRRSQRFARLAAAYLHQPLGAVMQECDRKQRKAERLWRKLHQRRRLAEEEKLQERLQQREEERQRREEKRRRREAAAAEALKQKQQGEEERERARQLRQEEKRRRREAAAAAALEQQQREEEERERVRQLRREEKQARRWEERHRRHVEAAEAVHRPEAWEGMEAEQQAQPATPPAAKPKRKLKVRRPAVSAGGAGDAAETAAEGQAAVQTQAQPALRGEKNKAQPRAAAAAEGKPPQPPAKKQKAGKERQAAAGSGAAAAAAQHSAQLQQAQPAGQGAAVAGLPASRPSQAAAAEGSGAAGPAARVKKKKEGRKKAQAAEAPTSPSDAAAARPPAKKRRMGKEQLAGVDSSPRAAAAVPAAPAPQQAGVQAGQLAGPFSAWDFGQLSQVRAAAPAAAPPTAAPAKLAGSRKRRERPSAAAQPAAVEQDAEEEHERHDWQDDEVEELMRLAEDEKCRLEVLGASWLDWGAIGDHFGVSPAAARICYQTQLYIAAQGPVVVGRARSQPGLFPSLIRQALLLSPNHTATTSKIFQTVESTPALHSQLLAEHLEIRRGRKSTTRWMQSISSCLAHGKAEHLGVERVGKVGRTVQWRLRPAGQAQ